MPLYDYQCKQCQQVAEVRHGFSEVYAEACAACDKPNLSGGELRQLAADYAADFGLGPASHAGKVGSRRADNRACASA